MLINVANGIARSPLKSYAENVPTVPWARTVKNSVYVRRISGGLQPKRDAFCQTSQALEHGHIVNV